MRSALQRYWAKRPSRGARLSKTKRRPELAAFSVPKSMGLGLDTRDAVIYPRKQFPLELQQGGHDMCGVRGILLKHRDDCAALLAEYPHRVYTLRGNPQASLGMAVLYCKRDE